MGDARNARKQAAAKLKYQQRLEENVLARAAECQAEDAREKREVLARRGEHEEFVREQREACHW